MNKIIILQMLKNVGPVRVYVRISAETRWALTSAHAELATHLPIMGSVALVSYKSMHACICLGLCARSCLLVSHEKFIRELCC